MCPKVNLGYKLWHQSGHKLGHEPGHRYCQLNRHHQGLRDPDLHQPHQAAHDVHPLPARGLRAGVRGNPEAEQVSISYFQGS